MQTGEPRLPTRQQVQQWTPLERAEIARLLDEFVVRPTRRGTTPRRRLLVLAVTIGGAIALLPWIFYLSATLPARAAGGEWRTAWVGFDIGLAGVLAVAGWLVWHRRLLAVVALAVAATLLLVDAWFDVLLSWGTSEQWGAVATALLGELPVAGVLVIGMSTVLRRTAAVVLQLRGRDASQPSLWKQPMVMRPATTAPEPL